MIGLIPGLIEPCQRGRAASRGRFIQRSCRELKDEGGDEVLAAFQFPLPAGAGAGTAAKAEGKQRAGRGWHACRRLACVRLVNAEPEPGPVTGIGKAAGS